MEIGALFVVKDVIIRTTTYDEDSEILKNSIIKETSTDLQDTEDFQDEYQEEIFVLDM